MTGWTEIENQPTELAQLGLDAPLLKPFDLNEMLERIAAATHPSDGLSDF
jgi:hypothetical protein